jgi:DNA-directed RNA polymerase subunit RPC12/RpoP
VTDETAKVLVDYGGFQCECRGKILVKGKGEMVTYLVKPKNEI